MRKEGYQNKSGYKLWLNSTEQDKLINHFEEDIEMELVVRLGLSGLRLDEILQVESRHINQIDKDKFVLEIPHSKSGAGVTPIDSEIKLKLITYKNARAMKKDEKLLEKTKRTYQRKIKEAAEALAEETENTDWSYLTLHDLRRSWATELYYSIDGARAREIVMSFGRWSDYSTFSQDYLGRPTDSIINEIMDETHIY